MIEQVIIKDPTTTPIPWWPKVEAFEGRERFEFRPGLNLLWGPNGSGKSSLLRMIARLTHCEQGGVPLVTRSSIHELKGKTGASLVADGQPVHFFDPSATPGLIGGQFDDDFFKDGMQQAMFVNKTSSGQQNSARFERILQSVTTLEKVALGPNVRCGDLPELDHLKPTGGSPGLRTLLLDEPDRSLSTVAQLELWNALARQERYQLIVATHSVFSLFLPDATYFDVVPGQIEASRDMLRGWISTVPKDGPR